MAADFLNELISAIKPKTDKKNRTHSAIVSKVDSDGVAWVYVAGSDRETPIASAASEIKRGDAVNVEWRNNKLYIAGNYSNPSAGVVRVTNVENAAQVANQLAGQASESAAVAQDAADRAVRDADTAHQAANTAQASADRSLVQLSIVEDVAGTLNWISEHGEYVATTDTQVDPNKVYFELVDGDYVPIANPDPEANPAESGWYILDVTDSQSDYIMAHLAVTSAGLWVLPSGQWAMHPLTDSDGDYLINSDGDYVSDWSKDPQNASGYKVLLSATGMTVFDGEGVAVASYGAEMVLGRLDSGNLIARPTGIAIRDGLEELATFSADGVQIGKDDEAHSTMDYHSFQTIDKEGDVFFNVQDLRDRNGVYQKTDTYIQGYYEEASFDLTYTATSDAYTVTVLDANDNDITSHFNILKTRTLFVFEPDGQEMFPAPGCTIIAVYETADEQAKVLTFGKDSNGDPTFNVDGDGSVNTVNTYKRNGLEWIKHWQFDLGRISITAGTPGTTSEVITVDLDYDLIGGYIPLSVNIQYVNASIIGFNAFFNSNYTKLYVQVIRRTTNTASPGYNAYADVTFIKAS